LKVIEKHKIGLAPNDVVYLAEESVFPLLEVRGIEFVDNWETLLKEISPEAY